MRFRYNMTADTARAAAVMMTCLLRGGISWTPTEDATPDIVQAAFEDYLAGQDDEMARATREDIDAFVQAANLGHSPMPITSVRVAGALRLIGAEPEAWLWGTRFGPDFRHAWRSCQVARHVPQLALAAGVDEDIVLEAVRDAVARVADRLKAGSEDQAWALRGIEADLARTFESYHELAELDPEQIADVTARLHGAVKNLGVDLAAELRTVLTTEYEAACPGMTAMPPA